MEIQLGEQDDFMDVEGKGRGVHSLAPRFPGDHLLGMLERII